MRLILWTHLVGSPAEAARLVGVSVQLFSSWLAGKAKPDFQHKAAIYKASHGLVEPADLEDRTLAPWRRCPCCGVLITAADWRDAEMDFSRRNHPIVSATLLLQKMSRGRRRLRRWYGLPQGEMRRRETWEEERELEDDGFLWPGWYYGA